MKRLLIVPMLVLCCVGCFDFNQAPQQIDRVPGLLAKSEPAIVALENAAGTTLSADTIATGEKVSKKVSSIATKAAQAAAVVASLPTPAAPIAATIAAILGAIGTASLGVSNFFARRRARRTQMGLDAVVIAVDSEPGIGAKINAVAKARGVADVVEDSYRDNRVN